MDLLRRLDLQGARPVTGAGLSFVIAPMLIGMALVARPLTVIALGEKWLPAVHILELYALATLLFQLLYLATALYFTKQRTDRSDICISTHERRRSGRPVVRTSVRGSEWWEIVG